MFSNLNKNQLSLSTARLYFAQEIQDYSPTTIHSTSGKDNVIQNTSMNILIPQGGGLGTRLINSLFLIPNTKCLVQNFLWVWKI